MLELTDNAGDIVMLAQRCTLGGFFLLARFRWLYDPSRPEDPWLNDARHKHLTWKMCHCHYGSNPYLSGTVAVLELLTGAALVVGLLTQLASLGLLAILAFATACTAREKVMEQSPVDAIDVVSCYLWRVEGLYILLAASILLMGPGAYSLDALILSLI